MDSAEQGKRAAEQHYEKASPGEWVWSANMDTEGVFRKGSKYDPWGGSHDPLADASDGCDWLFVSSEWSFVNGTLIAEFLDLLNEHERHAGA